MLAELRRRYRLKAFLQAWVVYRDLVSRTLAAPAPRAADDARLLALRGRLAAELQVISAWAPPALAAEMRQTDRQIMALLGGPTGAIGGVESGALAEAEFRRAWQEVYLSLNRLLGALSVRRPWTERPLPEALPAWGGRSRRGSPLLIGGPLRTFLAAVLTVAAIALLGLGLTTRWDTGGERFVARSDSSIAAAFTAAFNATYSTGQHVLGYLNPITAAYGIGLTIGLLALLALAATWWLLFRN